MYILESSPEQPLSEPIVAAQTYPTYKRESNASIHLIEDLIKEQNLRYQTQDQNNNILQEIHNLEAHLLNLKNSIHNNNQSNQQQRNLIQQKQLHSNKLNQKQQIELKVVKLSTEHINLNIDISRIDSQTVKIKQQMQRLYKRIHQVEEQLKQFKNSVLDLQLKNDSVERSINNAKEMINNHLYNETIWKGNSARNIINQKGNYYEIMSLFAKQINNIQHRISELKRQRPVKRQIKQQISSINDESNKIYQSNLKRKQLIKSNKDSYQQLQTRYFILQNDLAMTINQNVNNRVSEQKNKFKTKLQNQREIIQNLADLIRYKSIKNYNQALRIIEKNRE